MKLSIVILSEICNRQSLKIGTSLTDDAASMGGIDIHYSSHRYGAIASCGVLV